MLHIVVVLFVVTFVFLSNINKNKKISCVLFSPANVYVPPTVIKKIINLKSTDKQSKISMNAI